MEMASGVTADRLSERKREIRTGLQGQRVESAEILTQCKKVKGFGQKMEIIKAEIKNCKDRTRK